MDKEAGEGGLGMVLPGIRRDSLTPLAHPAICHPPVQDHTMQHFTNNVYQLLSPYYFFLFFFFLAVPQGVWDLSSLIRD